MKPIAIFQHAGTEGPGYFATYLDRHRIPWTLVRIDLGEAVPRGVGGYSGLVFMGGPMSVNDPLPWVAPVLALIRDAVAADIPVLGHCLGGQLMAKALGGEVTRNPVKEIGWGDIRVLDTPAATAWFGHAAPAFLAYHWHGETFGIPPGATRLLESAHCANQAFALGPHLGMQCHVEMTPEIIAAWCETGAGEIARNRSRSPAVQTREEQMTDLDARLAALHRVADAAYDRWAAGLAR